MLLPTTIIHLDGWRSSAILSGLLLRINLLCSQNHQGSPLWNCNRSNQFWQRAEHRRQERERAEQQGEWMVSRHARLTNGDNLLATKWTLLATKWTLCCSWWRAEPWRHSGRSASRNSGISRKKRLRSDNNRMDLDNQNVDWVVKRRRPVAC